MLPASMKRPVQPTLVCYCQWCAMRRNRKGSFKLRDGPIDWYFCSDEHALEWLENRHKTHGINAMLKLTPAERARALNGMSIEEFCSKELSH